jgi:hypothetical protein
MPPRHVSAGYERADHLTELDAVRYARGGAEEAEKAAVEQHISACAVCLLRLQALLRHPG